MKRFHVWNVFLIITLITANQSLSLDKKDVDIFKGYNELVQKAMKHWQVPGAAVVVVKDGEVVHMDGYGYRNVEKNLKVNNQTLFRIGSATKSFTAMAVGLLVDEGNLSWDTPIHKYMPDFRLYDDYVTLHATSRDLLCHQTGVGEQYAMFFLSPLNRREIYQRLRYLQPAAGFRQRHLYSNIMYMTLGILVEEISGSTWEEF